jgi:hypothetical protein
MDSTQDEYSESGEEPQQSKHTPLEDDTIVIFHNPEKENRRRLGKAEYMPNSSSRILLSGPPDSGKRNVILNVIHRMDPPPDVIHIVHCDPDTIEYDCLNDLGIPVLMYEPSDPPSLKNIEHPFGSGENNEEGDKLAEDPESESEDQPKVLNTVVIVDECPVDVLGKVGASRLERLVNHVCTHRNTTLICSIQSMLNIPPKARRGFNHIALWKQSDKTVNQMAASRAGIPYEMLDVMFNLCTSKYDFIWIDLDSPQDSSLRYRLNFVSPIRFIADIE